MTRIHYAFRALLAFFVTCSSLASWAANTKTTVNQVSDAVTVSADVDYIISSATPFTASGVINITNTEHAVLILQNVKPSAAIANYLKYVQINGVKAVNNTNCQVKLYNRGCIILPYSDGDHFKPLTVYSEKNFQGESCNDFGLEHTGGYMNTLTDAKLNNRISSFKLKRGYMVTFSLKNGGRGYSRCFIAADKDVEMASLPALMDNSISSYRVFKWYDTGKKNIASDTRKDVLAALNVQSCYDWGQGNSSLLPDYEWVPNHIYEDWPSSSAIGSTTQSPHTKNNNEPRNSSDDHPQDLATILGNWENMMRTGLRLCSPASWDGSDYWNAMGFLAEFLDSIDARGWRCDIIDLHCYWAEGSFGNMHYWSDKYKRPIWISEWCWGASWNNNGAFASGVTKTNVRDALERICTNLNNWDYVERYYYWNSEAAISKIYDGGLTPAGQYYAAMDAGLGYNGKYDFVPKTPKQYDPKNLAVRYDKNAGVATLSWDEMNGEMNGSMTVERRAGTGKAWNTIATVELKDDASSYTYADADATNGCEYRVHIVDANNKDRYSGIVMAASDKLAAGDVMVINNETKYLGGNIIVNGNFDFGFQGWTCDDKGTPLAKPYFQIVQTGGNDGGSYLQAYGHGSNKTEKSVYSKFPISENANYYFSVASCDMPSSYSNHLSISTPDKAASQTKVYINNTTSNWITQFGTFNSANYSEARITLYNLNAKARLDQFWLSRLFSTRDSAVADGVNIARLKAEAFKTYNTQYPSLNQEFDQVLTSVTTEDETALLTLETTVEKAIKAYAYLQDTALLTYAEKVAALHLSQGAQLEEILSTIHTATSIDDIVEAYTSLQPALDDLLPYTLVTSAIKNPSFSSTEGWTTKAGTYQGGDQRQNQKDNVTFWNAWWSNIDSDDTTQSMAIKQTNIQAPMHGLYALECKATTEHYCLSDQHGYITYEGQTENTQSLNADFFDLPIPAEKRWGTLYSAPVYVPTNAKMTIGFEGTKAGSLSDAWLPYGTTTNQKNDKREGWWAATDFALRFVPLYRITVVPDQYDVVCLPYQVKATETLHFYRIAGISSDYTQILLAEVDTLRAGVPAIFKSSVADAQFAEFGEAVKNASSGDGNLRGYFVTTGRVAANAYAVVDGAFTKVDPDNRPSIGYYRGYMRNLTDIISKGIPVYDSWDGPSMPIVGVDENEIAANTDRVLGIQVPVAGMQHDGIYTIDGRMQTGTHLKPGLYIKVQNGRAYKMIIK